MHIERILKEVVIDQSTNTLTAEIDLDAWRIAGIFMPSAWTAASLTFQAASESGGTFVDVYDDGGNEITVTAAASRLLALTSDDAERLSAVRWIKVRSGTTVTPVQQAAARTLTLVLVRC